MTAPAEKADAEKNKATTGEDRPRSRPRRDYRDSFGSNGGDESAPEEAGVLPGTGRGRGFRRFRDRRRCRFCADGVGFPDYKDVASLQKLLSALAKIYSRKRSGCCARHQRLAKVAITRARILALLPYIG